MAITRKLVATETNQDCQWLKIDNSDRYIENHSNEWQFLFNPNSAFSNSSQISKIGAEFNKEDLNSIYFTSYLYNQNTGNVDVGASCIFNFYKVTNPNWSETLIFSTLGSLLPTNNFYSNVNLSNLPGIDFEGGDVILVESIITRFGTTYRERAYINHLGVYDSIIRLRQNIDFLNITKQDI